MNIYEFSLTAACLLLVLLCVTATPIDLEDEMLEREVRGDDLYAEDMADLDDEMQVFRRGDDEFLREAKAAQWNKNFIGSSLDQSIKGFSSAHARCMSNDICKYAGKKMFKCKCNSLQYCVAPTPNSNARCRYSSVGFVFKQ